MQIKMVKTADIMPYENNPRHNDDAVEPVKESIKRYGFKVPMVLDKENIIVAGHTRYLAAQALGMDEVPVIYADDLTEEQVREFRLVDNKTSEFAVWDFGKLEQELEAIDWRGFDFGFKQSDMDVDSFFTGEEVDKPQKEQEIEPHQVICGCQTKEQYSALLTFCDKQGISYEDVEE